MSEANCKIAIPIRPRRLAPDIKWPTLLIETVWGLKTSDDTARVLNTPFFAQGINYLDDVQLTVVNEANEVHDFKRVIRRSGHRTVRAVLVSSQRQAIAERAIDEVEELGCNWEAGGAVVAVDIPPGVSEDAVLEILRRAEREDAIYIDIGF